MKVKELIELLSKCHPEDEVHVSTDVYECSEWNKTHHEITEINEVSTKPLGAVVLLTDEL